MIRLLSIAGGSIIYSSVSKTLTNKENIMIKSKMQLVKKTLGYSKVSYYSVQGDLGNWIRVTEDYIKQNFAGKWQGCRCC